MQSVSAETKYLTAQGSQKNWKTVQHWPNYMVLHVINIAEFQHYIEGGIIYHNVHKQWSTVSLEITTHSLHTYLAV
jgi:hypothetical protein